MKLYEIASGYREVLELMEADAHGDLKPLMDAIQDRLETKVDNICRMIRELELESEAYLIEAERLSTEAKKMHRKIDNLSTYISHCLDGHALRTQLFSLAFRKSEAVEIEDFETLPAQYKREKYVVEADKNLIKTDLKCGAEIPGVKLVTKQNLQIK